jgi:hypothetical protein
MLKFPTLLDTNMELIFTLHPWKKRYLRWSLQAVGPLRSPNFEMLDIFVYLCSIQQKNHFEDLRPMYTSKHGSCTSLGALTWSRNQLLPTAGSCSHGSVLKPIIWHNYITEIGNERFQTLSVRPARAIYSHKRLFRASQVQQLGSCFKLKYCNNLVQTDLAST